MPQKRGHNNRKNNNRRGPGKPALTGRDSGISAAASGSGSPGGLAKTGVPRVTAMEDSLLKTPQVDYGYVKKELKRIGLIAGAMFIVLAVLTFFIR
ncbi:MAG: hypothetical protein U1D67_03210 [Dehalococcoidia bacterium]|nr:hypothetical protein [Dehalococcoidia bacterium]